MKKINVVLFLLVLSFSVIGQSSIVINKKIYPFEKIDFATITINGWWRVVGGEFFNDEDGTSSNQKWDGRDIGKRIFISDSLMQFYSPSASLFYEKPKFEYLVFYLRTSDAGHFFKKFPSEVVGVNVYEYQDKEVWGGEEYAFGYQWFYILNSNFIAYFSGGNQVLYLERILNKSEQYGWDEEDGFKIIKYTGSTGYVKLNIEKEKYKDDSFFEIQVTPQFSCTDTWFNIATYPNYLAGGDKKKYLINSKKTPKQNTIYRLPLSTFYSSYIKVSLGNCDCNEEWILKWRIIQKDSIKFIKSNKAIIYKNPNIPTKMYLIKNDEVRLDKEEDDFYKITYMTNKGKIIEGYIKKTDVD